jgi:hypothetical protein
MKKNRSTGVNVLVVMVIVLLGVLGSEKAAGREAPSAVFPEPSFTFAPVPEGMVVTHNYPVLNEGNDDLEIIRIETT